MDDKDYKKFINDFKKGELSQKLDMWFYALEQESLWDEILTNMSEIANEQKIKSEIAQKKK